MTFLKCSLCFVIQTQTRLLIQKQLACSVRTSVSTTGRCVRLLSRAGRRTDIHLAESVTGDFPGRIARSNCNVLHAVATLIINVAWNCPFMCCLVTLIVFILMFCYSDTVYIFMTLYFNCMKLFSVGHHKTFNWKMDKYQIFLFSNGNCALSLIQLNKISSQYQAMRSVEVKNLKCRWDVLKKSKWRIT